MQMVDRYDRGALPNQDFSNSYSSLWKLVQKALFRTHVEGQLKGEIIQDPASYVELDPEMAKALLDQRAAVRSCSKHPAMQLTDKCQSCNMLRPAAMMFWQIGVSCVHCINVHHATAPSIPSIL